MPTLTGVPDALSQVNRSDESELSKMEERLPPLLSVIAGMVDLIGFFTLGSSARYRQSCFSRRRGGPRRTVEPRAGSRNSCVRIGCGDRVAYCACFEPARRRPDTTVSCDPIPIAPRGARFQRHDGALGQPARLDGRHRSHGRSLCNGISIRSHALGIAKGGFNGRDDRESD